MASTILVKDVIWRACVLLQDTVPQYQRNPEREVVDWLNDAQVAITKFLPAACSRLDAIKLVAGTRQSIESIPALSCKPGDGSTPSQAIYGTQLLDVVCNMGDDGLTEGAAIRQVPRELLDSQNPMWHTVRKSVVSSYTFDSRNPRYFMVSPGVPADDDVWVMASYTAQPIRIANSGSVGSETYLVGGSSTTTISIADEFVDDLVNYMCARANMKNNEWSSKADATGYTALFTSALNAKVMALTGNNPNLQRLPLAPEPLAQAS